MKPKLKKVAAYAGLILLAGILTLVGLVYLRHDRKFDAPYPDIAASKDPAVIARGHYLAYGLAHCVDCHGAPNHEDEDEGEAHEDIPLIGGHVWNLPIATVYSRNITPDPETGIGRYTDKELARILRYGVHADGRAVLPFMPFSNLSDEDLTAVISFLRSQKPVRNQVPQHDVNFAGKAVLAFVMSPKGPDGSPPKTVRPEPSAAYGKYLAKSVGNCETCHTKLDLRTGEKIGVPFAGGNELESKTDPSKKFITPNLTPDVRWGWLGGWQEDAFVARFRAGPVHEGSPMPWRAFSTVTEDDARALYRYLRTLEPAPGGPDPKKREVEVASAAVP